MPNISRELWVTEDPRRPSTDSGQCLDVPPDWALLPPGDAGLTRRVKKAGPTWTVRERKGRRKFSRGVWAPRDRIATLRAELEAEREDPAYERRLAAGRRRRAAKQEVYSAAFEMAVRCFLAFHPRHDALASLLSRAITAHAVPVGSGTVARTERIPLEQRAEAATIAWLRHQTTGYDNMAVPRVTGMRREIRRALAAKSRELLAGYRRGDMIDPARCPLAHAVASHAVVPPAQGGAEARGRTTTTA